jgi:ABC-2 type transport system permease protein
MKGQTREHVVGSHLVIMRHVIQRSLRWAAVWGAVFGLFVISTVVAYVKAYPTFNMRLELTRSLRPFVILLGVPWHAETVAGFATWRVLTAVAVIGAIWGLQTSTGLLRGDEEEGRWELLLAGPVTKRRAAAQALLGMAVALALMYLVTMLFILAAGRLPGARFSPVGSLLFAINLVSGAAMFLALGALTSQIGATRAQATTLGAGILGASFVVRAIADSENRLGWLRWLTPLGWIEELRPLRDPQPVALVPVAAMIFACVALTLVLAGARDLHGSVLRGSEGRRGTTWWLVGPTTLALYVSQLTAIGWLAGIIGLSAMFGSIVRASVSLTSTSPAITAALGRFGVRTATRGFLGFALFFVAVLLALMAAGQVGAMRDEEASGRLDNLLVRPVRRLTWLAGRLCVALGRIILGGFAAGAASWAGAATHHTYVPLPTLLEAGLNAAVPGIFVLGIGTLTLGLLPRSCATVSYAIVAWSFLADLLGTFVKGADWIRQSSIFTHISLAPAEKPDWDTAAIIVLLGLIALALGAAGFQRRDLAYQ